MSPGLHRPRPTHICNRVACDVYRVAWLMHCLHAARIQFLILRQLGVQRNCPPGALFWSKHLLCLATVLYCRPFEFASGFAVVRCVQLFALTARADHAQCSSCRVKARCGDFQAFRVLESLIITQDRYVLRVCTMVYVNGS